MVFPLLALGFFSFLFHHFDLTQKQAVPVGGQLNFQLLHDWLISRSMFYFLNLTAYGLVP